MNTSAVPFLLNPDPAAPARIVREVTSILIALPYVRRIAVFGSVAEDRADGWSDVDFLIACDSVEHAGWAAAQAIRAAKPVLFYRAFSTASQPNGRYWFVGESPFHKIDISFDPIDEYLRILSEGGRLGHSITSREIYQAPDNCEAEPEGAPESPLLISERESEIGNCIYQSLRSLKRRMRSGEDFDEHAKGFDGIRQAALSIPYDAIMAGGRIGELIHQIAEMIDCCARSRRLHM